MERDMRVAMLAVLVFLAVPAFAETPPVTSSSASVSAAAPDADPFLWLEDVHGEKSLAWVEKENARSLARLKGDPRYEAFHREALTIVNATDRIPAPDLIG